MAFYSCSCHLLMAGILDFGLIKFLIPLSKISQSFSQSYLGPKAKILLQSVYVRIGCRHVPRLHWHQLPAASEIKIRWQHFCTDQFLLQNIHFILYSVGHLLV